VKPLVLALIVLSCGAFALSACGESKEDKAKKQVCSARSDIAKQMDSLKSVTISSSTPNDVKTAVNEIKSDLSKMKDAQPDLAPGRKQQVKTATQTFGTQLQQIVSSAVTGLTATNARSQIQAAVTSLQSAYKQALAPIAC
jgi:hypothetical protein